MAVNKVTFTINSRQYTVVAEESVEYIEKLCAHIDEKVKSVISGGENVLGERPVVIAALNICDEYYKSLGAIDEVKAELQKMSAKNLKLQQLVKDLQKELSKSDNNQVSMDEAQLRAEKESSDKSLAAANGRIKYLEDKIKSLEKRYNDREKEIMEMIDAS